MRNSIKLLLRITIIVLAVISYITALLVVTNFGSNGEIITLSNIIVLCIIVVISFVISTIISKVIVFPIRKLEKGMKSVSEGKIPETKYLRNYSNLSEMKDLIDEYSAMMQLIKKNNFDLNSQQSKTEIILEHIADGVVAFSITKQVIHMNKSAMRLLGIGSLDDTFDKIINKLKITLEFDKIMYLPNYKSIESKVTVGENTLNIIFIPFFSDKLSPMGVIMMVRNITETVKLDNLRKEFVANVSHELKTPLTSIKGYSETIMNGDLTYQEIVKFSRVINQEANRMGRLVSDLLQLSRFDYKKVSWKKMMFSLDELDKNIVDFYKL